MVLHGCSQGPHHFVLHPFVLYKHDATSNLQEAPTSRRGRCHLPASSAVKQCNRNNNQYTNANEIGYTSMKTHTVLRRLMYGLAQYHFDAASQPIQARKGSRGWCSEGHGTLGHVHILHIHIPRHIGRQQLRLGGVLNNDGNA